MENTNSSGSSEMDIHERLMSLETVGLVALELLGHETGKKSILIRQLLRILHMKLWDGKLELKVLETLRMIHCDEYQTSVKSGSRFSYSKKGTGHKMNFHSVFDQVVEGFTDSVEFRLLYDIVALQLALSCCEEKTRFLFFTDFFQSQKNLHTNPESLRLCLKMFESIADSFSLHSRVEADKPRIEFEQSPDCVIKVMEFWMKQEELKEVETVTRLLPKLVLLFGAKNIVTPLWKKLLEEENDLNKVLDVLCLFADVCFPTESNLMTKIRYEYCVSSDFWSTLLRGLDSNICEERAKAFYLFKRVLDFVETHESQIMNDPEISNAQMVPFLRNDAEGNENSRNLMKKYFLALLQSSEEKKKHLAMLRTLPDLVKAYSSQNTEGYYFHKKWLQCVFKRVLRHEHIAVKKFGLREILAADLDIYDESFIEFLAYSLNNTLLFDFDYSEEVNPEIVEQLVKFFTRSERAHKPLIKMFIRVISRLSWCELSIYWILQALNIAASEIPIICNVWSPEELKCVKNLITFNFTRHRPLVQESRDALRKIFCKYIPTDNFWPQVQLVTSTIALIARFDWLEGSENHIKKIIKPEDAQTYVCEQCASLWSGQTSETFANTIIVLIRSNLIFSEKDCRAQSTLHDLFQKLSNRYRRFFTITKILVRLLDLATNVINATQFESPYTTKIKQFLAPHIQELIHMMESCATEVCAPIKEYTTTATALIKYNLRENIENFTYFYDCCLDVLSFPNKLTKDHFMYALNCINFYNKHHLLLRNTRPAFDDSKLNIKCIVKYLKEEIIEDGYQNDENKIDDFHGKSEIMECCENIATLICDHLKFQRFDNQQETNSCFNELEFLVGIEPEVTIGVVAQTFRELVDPANQYEALSDENMKIFRSIVQLSFDLMFSIDFSDKGRAAIYGLAKLIISSHFLKLEGAEEIAVEWVNKLMENEDKTPTFKLIFISKEWKEREANLFIHPFINCLLHGVSLQPDQKIIRAVDVCYGFLQEIEYRRDKVIPAHAIVSLMTLLERKKSLESIFRNNIVQELLGIWRKYQTREYFHDSQVHRIKQRIMQALLVIESFMTDKEAKDLYTEMCNFLIAEKNEPSVQLMQEWLIVRIYANTLMDESIWNLIERAMGNNPVSIIAVATILFHVSKLLESETKIKFICKAISQLLPICMSPQNALRLCSQVILVKLHEMLPEFHRERYRSVVSGIEMNLRSDKSLTNAVTLMDGFYLNDFHANDDYNLQFIYEHLPRLLGSPINERIEASIFRALMVSPDNSFIPLHCSSKWERTRPQIPIIRPADLFDENRDSDEENIPRNEEIVENAEREAIALRAEIHQRIASDTDGGIVVVSSLIDDEPRNLERVVRTCEIYAAKEVVIGGLTHETLRALQRSNVLTENAIKILEMNKYVLKYYLLEQQSNGWKIVGAKRRADNANPCEVEFAEKTILLLGIEQNDTPEDLLEILDVCVEIP